MARRLLVPREPTDASRLLPGVLKPEKCPGGVLRFVRCLVPTLHFLGLCDDPDDAYDELMGLCGWAFTVPVQGDFDAAAIRLPPLERTVEALAGLALTAEWVFARDDDALLGPIRASLDTGAPVPVLNWPEGVADWSLVTGYDLGRNVLCGWPAGDRGNQYVGAPPAGDCALCLRPAPDPHPQSREQAFREALCWAAGRAGDIRRGYATWLQALGDDALWSRADEATVSRILRHEKATETLDDARTSAQNFLTTCAEAVAVPAPEWLEQAADRYAQLLDVIASRPPADYDAETPDAFADPAWRRHWADVLRRIEALDLQALDCIHRALSPTATAPDPDFPDEEWP